MGVPKKEDITMHTVDQLVDEILIGNYSSYQKVNEAYALVDEILDEVENMIDHIPNQNLPELRKTVSDEMSKSSLQRVGESKNEWRLFEKDLTNGVMKVKMKKLSAKCKGIEDEKKRQECLRKIMKKLHNEWKIHRVLEAASTPLEEKMALTVKLLLSETEYKEFFRDMMKNWGITSIEDLSDEKKKKFFNAVDKAWKAKKETD